MVRGPNGIHDSHNARRRLLRLAALSSPDLALDAWRAWSATADPWRFDPGSHWWFPLVWWNLKDAPLESQERIALRQEYTHTWIRHQHTVARVAPVLEALHREGIRTLLLKGAALSVTAYDRPGLRPFGDIDVLVSPDAADLARRVVERSGWVPIRHVPRSLTPILPSLGYTDAHGVDLDLHWQALTECTAPDVDRRFWDRAVPARFGDVPTHVLCPSDQLLHVCVHGLRFAWIPSEHWMADAFTILRRSGDALGWDACVAEARERRLTFQLVQALGALEAVQPIPLSAEAMTSLRKEWPAWWEPFEYRAKRRTTHGAVVIQAWCAQSRARAMGHRRGRWGDVTARLQAVAACESPWQMISREALTTLRWRGRKSTHALEAYGRRIQIDADADVDMRRVRDALDERLPRFRRLRGQAQPDRVYEILPMTWATPPAPRYRVLVNRRPLAATATLDEAADVLVSDLQGFLSFAAAGRTFVHAGVVMVRGRAVVLPGASGSGKSTLVAALLRAGATYASDEFAILDDHGSVHPYARPLRLRPSGSAEQRVRADTWGARTSSGACPAGLVLFAAYLPDGQLNLQPVSASTALLRLLNHCPGAQARPAETLAALKALVETAPAWATDRGETDSLVAAILEGSLSSRGNPPATRRRRREHRARATPSCPPPS
jgi:hypothetical protein